MNGLKNILFGTGMFGLGAVSGYFVCKKLFSDKYRADVADIQAFYKQKLDELGVMEDGFEPPDDSDRPEDPNDEDDEEDDDELGETIEIYKNQTRRVTTDYTKKYTKPPLESVGKALRNNVSVVVPTNGDENLGNVEDNEEDPEYTPRDDPQFIVSELEKMADEYARRRSENMKKGEPYLIEPEEYHDGPEDYDHQALYYYAEDRTLCEDDDRQVEDEEECVGFDYEDKLDMQMTCWVRNDKLRVLYEIHRIDESYQKAVLGVSETPREREFRIQGRRKQALDDQPKPNKGPKSLNKQYKN